MQNNARETLTASVLQSTYKGNYKIPSIYIIAQASVPILQIQPCAPSKEEGADLPGFTPSHTHEFLVEVYGHNLHHNYGMHLNGGVAYNALWQTF